jgi:hypothetical protein
MELLISPKSVYLLEAGLEVLHEQSNEWRNEIAFWRDEASFLYTLIVTKTIKSIPVDSKNNMDKIEKDLIKITGGEIDDLENKVIEHQKFLNYLIQCNEEDQKDYRDKHKELTKKLDYFEKRFKSLKKEVFSLVKKVNK